MSEQDGVCMKEHATSQLASAFVMAQRQMKHARLDGTNPHFKSKYSTLQSVIDAVKPSLNENGIAFIQKAMPAVNGVCVETVFIHESGEMLSGGTVFVPIDKINAHGAGSAYTYAKRYGLAMACGVGADEDDDGNSAVAADHKLKDISPDIVKARDHLAFLIDGCFTVEGEGRTAKLECVDTETLTECIEKMKANQELKLAVWSELGPKVRAFIKDMEKV